LASPFLQVEYSGGLLGLPEGMLSFVIHPSTVTLIFPLQIPFADYPALTGYDSVPCLWLVCSALLHAPCFSFLHPSERVFHASSPPFFFGDGRDGRTLIQSLRAGPESRVTFTYPSSEHRMSV